jgi:hypothetical protein
MSNNYDEGNGDDDNNDDDDDDNNNNNHHNLMLLNAISKYFKKRCLIQDHRTRTDQTF